MFQTEQDGYVTVLRVDTDGRVRVLFPREPWEDNLARGGRVYEVRDAWGFSGFRADAYPGLGYLFAVVAAEPFIYDPIESEQRWNYELVADGGRIRGDPYAALTELAARIVPEGSQDWDYDIAPYHVQRHYDYPRFLCFDCHAYAGFRTWNPYDYTCVRFRVVVFDDPYYYPYRWYGGTRAVIRRPQRLEPRFIFRDRGAADAFFTRIPRAPGERRSAPRCGCAGARHRQSRHRAASPGGHATPAARLSRGPRPRRARRVTQPRGSAGPHGAPWSEPERTKSVRARPPRRGVRSAAVQRRRAARRQRSGRSRGDPRGRSRRAADRETAASAANRSSGAASRRSRLAGEQGARS